MAYITREDGERFVIPSYREVLSSRQKSVLKKDILLLSQSYGEYITLQEKPPLQCEVAFSPDTGHLLGETVWYHFKRPSDLIYCEAIPGTTEAILVIVKSGSVYLDGRFPLESIAEELIIFLTQENHFEIYVYGDVPISEKPEEGKFSFETSSVVKFTVLQDPAFPTLPLLKIYQLQLVDPVLKAHGIGVYPVKQFVVLAICIALLWMAWSYLTKPSTQIIVTKKPNPFQPYYDALSSPVPDEEIQQFLSSLALLYTMPGWTMKSIDYSNGTATASVISAGSKTETLFEWAKINGATVDLKRDGIFVSVNDTLKKRAAPTKIYPLKKVIANFIDRLSRVYPGNHLSLGDFANHGVYTQDELTIKIDKVTPIVLSLIAEQLNDLPLTLKSMSFKVDNGSLSGSIIIEALGS